MAGIKRKRNKVEETTKSPSSKENKDVSTPKRKKLSLKKPKTPPALNFEASPVAVSDLAAKTLTAGQFDTPSGSIVRKGGKTEKIDDLEMSVTNLRKPSDDMDATLSHISGNTEYRSHDSNLNGPDNVGTHSQDDILSQDTVHVNADQNIKDWMQQMLVEQRRGIDEKIDNLNENLVRLTNIVSDIHDAVLTGLGVNRRVIDAANNQEVQNTSDSEDGDFPVPIPANGNGTNGGEHRDIDVNSGGGEPVVDAGHGDDDIRIAAEITAVPVSARFKIVETIHLD